MPLGRKVTLRKKKCWICGKYHRGKTRYCSRRCQLWDKRYFGGTITLDSPTRTDVRKSPSVRSWKTGGRS